MEGLIKQEYQEIPEYEVLRPATGCFQCQGLMGLLYEIKNSIDNLASKIENIQEDVGILKALQYPCPSETQETCQADDQSPKIQIVNKTQPQITPQENQLPHWPIQSLEEVDRVIRNFENEQYKDSVESIFKAAADSKVNNFRNYFSKSLLNAYAMVEMNEKRSFLKCPLFKLLWTAWEGPEFDSMSFARLLSRELLIAKSSSWKKPSNNNSLVISKSQSLASPAAAKPKAKRKTRKLDSPRSWRTIKQVLIDRKTQKKSNQKS